MSDRIFGPAFDDTGTFPTRCNLHATSVCFGARGLVLTGESGSGKSGLALQLMALGAMLVSDDRTQILSESGVLYAQAPHICAGEIEARGFGVLRGEYQQSAVIVAVIDMDIVEKDRLPPLRNCSILGVRLPLFHKLESGYFPAAIIHYLKGDRSAQ